MNKKLILTIGISGSGKTTWCKTLDESFKVVSVDDLRIKYAGDINDKSIDDQIYKYLLIAETIEALKQSDNVVIDSTNLQKERRQNLIKNIKERFFDVEVLFKLFDTRKEYAIRRIKDDLENGIKRAKVPDSTIERHFELICDVIPDLESENIKQMEALFKQDFIQEHSTFLGSVYSTQLGRFIDSYLGFMEVGTLGKMPYEKNFQKGYLSKTGTVPIIIFVSGDHSQAYFGKFLWMDIPESEWDFKVYYEESEAIKKAVKRNLVSQHYLKFITIIPDTRIEMLRNAGWEMIDEEHFKNPTDGKTATFKDAFMYYVLELINNEKLL